MASRPPAPIARAVRCAGAACVAAVLQACTTVALPPDPARGAILAGAWVAPEFASSDTPGGPVMPRIEFRSTGSASGSGGCNAFGGGYTLDGGVLRIGPLASTRKACLGAAMEQEARFLAAIERTRGARPAGDGIELLDAEGRVTVRLSRQR